MYEKVGFDVCQCVTMFVPMCVSVLIVVVFLKHTMLPYVHTCACV